MTDRSVFTLLDRAINKLDSTLDSAEVALNGVELAQLEDVVNDLKDARAVLNKIKGTLCDV